MLIRPYLNFMGECQQAIDLYCRAFRTQASRVFRFSEMPPNPANRVQIPPDKKDWVVQATLPLGGNFIRMSDTLAELNDKPTERIGISVECEEGLVRHAFSVLSEEGSVKMPLERTFFSPCYGVVCDKFGVLWNLVSQE